MALHKLEFIVPNIYFYNHAQGKFRLISVLAYFNEIQLNHFRKRR